jgi:meiotically up-regulated gene 157 (Mug157) protein
MKHPAIAAYSMIDGQRELESFSIQYCKLLHHLRLLIGRSNQRIEPGGYSFKRDYDQPTETLLHGVGQPTRFCGLSRSPFRPSDDAAVFPYLVPANAMADVSLRKMMGLGLLDDYTEAYDKVKRALRGLEMGLNMFGIVHHPYYGR